MNNTFSTINPIDDSIYVERPYANGDDIQKRLDKPGSPYLAPQILTEVNHTMRIMTEESFGAVLNLFISKLNFDGVVKNPPPHHNEKKVPLYRIAILTYQYEDILKIIIWHSKYLHPPRLALL